MKNKKEDQLEKLIKETIHSDLENSPDPPLSVEEAWEKLNSKRDRSPKKTFTVPKIVVAAILFLLLGSSLFMIPNSGNAFKPLTEMYHTASDSVTRIFIKSETDSAPKESNLPSPDNFEVGEPFTTEKMPLEDAQKVTAFPIRVPKYIPEGFTLQDVTVLSNHVEKSQDIYLNYFNNEKRFAINQILMGEMYGSGRVNGVDESSIEEISINGEQATLIQYKEDLFEIIWTNQSYEISISGTLSRDEIIAIAESL
ncbi:DUF4367 domain-containing protein [Bacillaceae bacterium S4-13-56]